MEVLDICFLNFKKCHTVNFKMEKENGEKKLRSRCKHIFYSICGIFRFVSAY